MRFVHCADVHLDSPLRGLDVYEGAPVDEIRGATRRAFDNVVDLCLLEQVDLLVVAGDLYDGDWADFNTGLYFARQMARLGEHSIRVFLVRGNHDAESRITKRLSLPSNVHVFGSRKPETCRLEDVRVALHGQSFARPEVTNNLAVAYPPPVKGWFNIGVLHTALDGREGHAPYAPCELGELTAKGYDYWALGHVHKGEVLAKTPWVVFPGCVQGRHVRETGAKGASLVTVTDGRVKSVEHHDLDVLRWAKLEVDTSGVAEPHEALERVQEALQEARKSADGRLVAARLGLHGKCQAHDAIASDAENWKQQVRAAALEAGQGEVWVEKVLVNTEPPLDLDTIRERDDAIGELLRSVQQVMEDPSTLEALGRDIAPFLAKLPHEIREGGALPDADSLDQVRALVEEAQQLLLARLKSTETTQ